jgi:outer membrane protein assembly factor BamA
VTLRHSSLLTGSAPSQRFNKAIGAASWYWPLGANLLLAHIQLGSVFEGDAPPQERLYAGGPTTVRGFRQNELGPAVYLVSNYETFVTPPDIVSGKRDTFFLAEPEKNPNPDRTIPAGGNTLVVGNLELQLRSPILPELVRFALFTDAGEVWNRGALTAEKTRLRFTPGAGIRVRTLFGVVRADLGYNPYPPVTGAAYAIATGVDGKQALYCVSPGNELKVTSVGHDPEGRLNGIQQPGECEGLFTPKERRGFFRRLNPSIWIGNAF